MRSILNASKRLNAIVLPPVKPGVFTIKDVNGKTHMSGPTPNLKALYLAYRNRLDNKNSLLSPLLDIVPADTLLSFTWSVFLTEEEAIAYFENSVNLKHLFSSSEEKHATVEYVFDKKVVSYILSEKLARSLYAIHQDTYDLVEANVDSIVLREKDSFEKCNIPVTIQGKLYCNYKAAARALKVNIGTVVYRCNSIIYPEWYVNGK